MKSIKCIFVLITLFGLVDVSAQTYSSTTVPTPNYTSVPAYQWNSGDWSQYDKDYLRWYWEEYTYKNKLTFEDEATYKYNCHSYAWANNTSNIWIDSPNQLKFINDWSYIFVPDGYLATKVKFNSDDHSALKLSNAGIFSSKWGPSPRYTHSRYDCPYTASSVSFYKRYNPSYPYYISKSQEVYESSSHTVYSYGSSYVYETLYAFNYPLATAPTSYSWSAYWYGDCSSWSVYPSSNSIHAQIDFYNNNTGGFLRLICDFYSGSTLLGTAYYSLYAYP